ncbi:hypothetical protein OT109_07985 [Phycisphaeraceae bacterium D3-23]
MQLMTWQLARLGSRFGLLFEPYKQRVMHGAMGRFLDRPLDLCVGMVEPDGAERVLPFTKHGRQLVSCEQFERFNSITFRAYSEVLGVRFELNLHSPFYPQDEKLCTMPVFYLECRVHHMVHARWRKQQEERAAEKVKLFLRLSRPDTEVTASDGQIDLAYGNHLTFNPDRGSPFPEKNPPPKGGPTVAVRERIVSLTPGATPTAQGDGIEITMPVTMPDAGEKWRLLWCAHVADPVMQVGRGGGDTGGGGGRSFEATFRYVDHWPDLDALVEDAVETRDDHLAHSRRTEKLIQQAPLNLPQAHLLNQSWQSYLANTWWMSHEDPGVAEETSPPGTRASWFSVTEGSRLYQSTLNAECNSAMFYLALWPKLLRMQLSQWIERCGSHEESGGRIIVHDLGLGLDASHATYKHPSPAEQNSDFLALLQAYCHWTGDTALVREHHATITGLAKYLDWTDRDHSGFPSVGHTSTHSSRYTPGFRASPKQTYLAIKRIVGLRAAADLLKHAEDPDVAPDAKRFDERADDAANRVSRDAWVGDHLAVCVDPALEGEGAANVREIYCIYNSNGELLPYMAGVPTAMPRDLIQVDIYAAQRETKRRYGNCNTTVETDHLRISQNLWRDMLARYLQLQGPSSASHYWDMQVMANTHHQSKGFVDAYITDNLAHYPRGVTTLGYFLATPQLIIDKLAPGAGGTYITIDPDRRLPARWPLLPLADWKAGRVPIAVVDAQGRVTIEAELDPIIIHGQQEVAEDGLIG